MGSSVTPKYRMEVVDHGGYKWQIAFPFKATEKNVLAYVNQFNKSVLEGHNNHLGKESLIHTAKIVGQSGSDCGRVVLQVNVVNVL